MKVPNEGLTHPQAGGKIPGSQVQIPLRRAFPREAWWPGVPHPSLPSALNCRVTLYLLLARQGLKVFRTTTQPQPPNNP